uniref:Uncharacterized protein n=1 Tax=Lygus hesperus TaxID=30085 RepID=A0A146KMS9_LYGHE
MKLGALLSARQRSTNDSNQVATIMSNLKNDSTSSKSCGANNETGKSKSDVEEDAREIYDASGKLVGLSVSRKVAQKISVDSTLLRDASSAVVRDHASEGNGHDVHKSLQDVFYRHKKGTRRH